MAFITSVKHFTIPLFIPFAACPFKCIFCDQEKITGSGIMPGEKEIRDTIEKHLSTFPEDSVIEAGYFGGTFTGLPPETQQNYLKIIKPYIDSGRITGIRVSTRPDFIDQEKLSLLAANGVKMIELGVQSFDDEVLRRSGRGHTVADSVRASEMILQNGISLGLQMMVGLPGDSKEKVVFTAKEIVRLGASETRIYPVIVISGTPLEKLYLEGKYKPLSLENAVQWTKGVMEVFENSGVKVIRVGLHNSGSAENGYIAGPVHVSFRELVMTEIWRDRLLILTHGAKDAQNIRIRVNPADINNATGYHGKNKKMLSEKYRVVDFIADPAIPLKQFHADHY